MLITRRVRALVGLLCGLSCGQWGCAHGSQTRPDAQEGAGAGSESAPVPRVIPATDRPVLFLGPEPDAPVFGFVAGDTEVQVSGPARDGRVPVRIDGAVRVKAFVPEELLTLRVQRRGRVRGTPTYVGPNDLVRPRGPASEENRLRVVVVPIIGGRPFASFEGTYPLAGLAAGRAQGAETPDAGSQRLLPAGRTLTLYDAPGGARVASVPAATAALPVTVVAEEQGWLAVRVGEGPYLIGYTQDALDIAPAHAAPAPSPPPSSDAIPRQLAAEGGALKLLAADTRVSFNDQVVAVFKTQGWARVLAEYPEGLVDVFAAADDSLAVRGLVPSAALSEPAAAPRAPEVFEEPQAQPDSARPSGSAPAASAAASGPSASAVHDESSSRPSFGLAPWTPPASAAAASGQ